MEPLGGIEPPTFALPRRRYTPKPQWQWRGHQWTRFNHCGFSSEEGVQMQQAQVGDITRRLACRDRIAWYCARLEILWDFPSGVQISLSAPPPATTCDDAERSACLMRCLDLPRPWKEKIVAPPPGSKQVQSRCD